jgi:hypothetical protein
MDAIGIRVKLRGISMQAQSLRRKISFSALP